MNSPRGSLKLVKHLEIGPLTNSSWALVSSRPTTIWTVPDRLLQLFQRAPDPMRRFEKTTVPPRCPQVCQTTVFWSFDRVGGKPKKSEGVSRQSRKPQGRQHGARPRDRLRPGRRLRSLPRIRWPPGIGNGRRACVRDERDALAARQPRDERRRLLSLRCAREGSWSAS